MEVEVKRPYWRKSFVPIDYEVVRLITNIVEAHFEDNLYPETLTRQVIAHCLWVFTGLGKRQIGSLINGGQDHSTIIHSLKMVRKHCEESGLIRERIINIETLIEKSLNEIQ